MVAKKPPAKKAPPKKRARRAPEAHLAATPPSKAAPIEPTLEELKHKFAKDLFADVEKLRASLFDEAIEKRTSVVTKGGGGGSEVVITEVVLEQPTFRDQRVILQAIAIGLEKVLQLDTGEGSNVVKVVELLESLRQEKALDTKDEALGQLAMTLARALDDGAGMAAAAMSRELRATLAALAKEPDESDDPLFGDDLSAEVRHQAEP